jgi:predicted DsbA family dithiol-disulfide isomerase
MKHEGWEMPELEIFSDFNCVWCYFDKPSIRKLEKEYDVEVCYRAFPLHIDIPEKGMPIAELFNHNLPLMDERMQKIEKVAASLGLTLARRASISDSRLSQELAKWSETKGRRREFQDAVFKAYFSDGLNIAEKSVLAGIAESCGLLKTEALDVLETRAFSGDVDKDWKKSEEMGIMVAPTYILNGNRLMGSQSYEKFEKLMIENQVPRKKE